MIRCSKLNEAENCGLAGSIDLNATSIFGMMGDAFHAANAAHYRPGEQRFTEERAIAFGVIGQDKAADVTIMLKDLWRTWTPPEHAMFEKPMALNRDGLAVPYGSDKAITQGTADCVWLEGDYVVVIDFKSGARAEWNVPLPADNLQLLAYAFGFADLLGKTKVKIGIYLAASDEEKPEDRWRWAEIDLDTPAATQLWERVRAAALHDPNEAVLGPHCGECFNRIQCRAYMIPAISDLERTETLSVVGTDEGVLPPERMLKVLQVADALGKLSESAKDWAKAYVAKYGDVVINGKKWGPIPMKGKESTSVSKLREAGLYDRAVAVGAVTTSAPSKQHRWTNAKGAQ